MKLIWQIFLVLTGITFSCKKPPEFPKEPEIAFLSLSKSTVNKYVGPLSPANLVDSVTISLSFKDGDGDLGRADTKDNFFCRVLLKKEGKFVDLIDSVDRTKPASIVNKNGRFFSLNPDGRQGPLEGSLFYGPSLNFSYLLDTNFYMLKFQVYVEDNSGHKSNTVETSEIGVKLY